MTNRTISAILSAFLFLYINPGSIAQTASQEDPLLTVGGKPVSRDEFVYLIGKGSNSDANTPGLSREEFEENLDLFINYKLKVREAEALGLDETTEFKREFASFKESLKSPFLIKNSLEDGELRKAYSRMQEVIRASHILFQFPPNASSEDSLIVLKMALKIKQEIQNGGDINALAVEYSDDPSAKINKGDLGYFTALQMVQQFEDAAFTLQPGQVSDPVLTSFGYHIIKVQERQPNPGQVQVSHILVRVDETNPNSENQARRKISDIYTEIQKPTTLWEDIVKNYSEDPATSKKGGLLPWFSVGNMIPEFEMAAFSLTEIGEVSPPVKTRYGYHILRLENKKPIDSFEEMEDMIRSRILRDSRSTMIQSQVLAIQKARYGFKENEANVEKLRATLNTKKKNEFRPEITALGMGASNLFTLRGKAYSTEDMLTYMETDEVNPKTKGGTFDIWYDRFAGELLAQIEEEDLEANNKEYAMLLKEYRDGILLFTLMNEEVWQKGIQDSIGQRAFYEQNIRDYQWGERVNAFIVKVLDINKLEQAKSRLQGNAYSESLVNEFEEFYKSNDPLAYQTQSGLIEIADNPILSKADLSKSFQEIEADGHLHLVVVGAKVPPGPMAFEETRGPVIRDYQEYLDKQLIQSLRKKYPIKVNKSVKEEAFIALNQ
ncbi:MULTISPECIES: peptidylprolyl isomerase [unclassified Algoriphagus]|jgi:peptidyl-prolyl cis-trans isomerase SurA|uniref:peptidylprolyl isomerase n=2 Tax=Algoriphagus TaxID=246875 RepID=UPI000C4E0322|nr:MULTISPECIES: peptidylprolyl isomerase [unclassified Algoriphagus]MAL12340.1 peptidylprolyl isomerase [Algoriphagus sp.]MAN88623.1 peptidylprolyl isomerase [Algoriphagus sp.]QYH40193.1 peptidylprolyl isomerase [Algoriphagus sp. NBT04N3]HAD49976.1 peptidylprolyl isomerase [Algoriphagus sp.]HAH37380.1 peptidylprolyl isomerase [Algoriphagus sp.]|tara:strand:- start:1516 stop:3507 length:1992 start_codon:yes stop_codon:yes gene_type:complete